MGVVPAVGNSPGQTSELAIPSIPVATIGSISSQPSSTIVAEPPATTSQAALQLASIGIALNQTTQAVTAMQIGIIQAIPNNPGLSPELTSFPPIDPAQLAAASSILASIQSTADNVSTSTVTSSAESTTTINSSSSSLIEAVAPPPSQTGPVLVQSTSFPLVGSNPQPDVSTTPEAVILPSSVVSSTTSSAGQEIPSVIPDALTQAALLPFIGTIGSQLPSATSSSTTQGSSGGRTGGRRPHHGGHGNKSSTSRRAPVAAPTLAIPNPSANPASGATTVIVPDPSGLVVVPINIPTTVNNKANGNKDGPTVTVTVTVASTTITASFLTVSTVTVTG